MSPLIQLTIAILATVAAIASAVAAWKAQAIAFRSFDLQKKITKHQQDIFLIRSTISSLWQLKRTLSQPLAASDNDVAALDNTLRQIRLNLESLSQSGTTKEETSAILSNISWTEIARSMPKNINEIDLNIKQLEKKLDDIFS